jgi:hypothetical protein
MPYRLLPSLIWLLVSGCATPQPANTTGDEAARAAARSARERYRAMQDAQRPAPANRNFETITVTRPETIEDGVIRKPFTETLRIPRTP